jgi:hypothetical protein
MISRKWKDESGTIAIEATISLTLFILFILFFMNFAKIYQAQNLMAFGALETAKAISYENYMKEALLETDIGGVLDALANLQGDVTGEDKEAILMGGLEQRIQKHFYQFINGDGQAGADQYMKMLGIKDGTAGLNFSSSSLDDEKVVVSVHYQVQFMVPLFGIDHVDMEESAASRLWKFTKWGWEVNE